MTSATEGTCPFEYPNLPKPCETWYKVFGDLKSSRSGRPLVLLHGGPGATSRYLLSLQNLAKNGIPVVFYDQLGCGNSTRLPEKALDTSFWTPELFIAELDNLVKHLGIDDGFDLLGHSWGGMLGSMYAVRGHKGLKNLIISNSPASMALWVDSCNQWMKELPDDIRETIEKYEKSEDFENPEYQQATNAFYKKHVCRIDPYPPEVQETFDLLAADSTVYLSMNGPTEFSVRGSLKPWSMIGKLHDVKVPTLVLSAEFDEGKEFCLAPFFKEIPKVKWYHFSGASHMAHVEMPEKYQKVVSDFLAL